MKKEKNIDKQVSDFQSLGRSSVSPEQKLDELIALLEQSDLDSETVSRLKDRFDHAVERIRPSPKDLRAFKKLDNTDQTRLEKADDLEILLQKYHLDSKAAKEHAMSEKAGNLTLILISLLLIVLGFAMIVMPAPPYFEMFTIFYFTTDDGVTLMDLISLLIVFAGVYLLVTSIAKLKRQRQ